MGKAANELSQLQLRREEALALVADWNEHRLRFRPEPGAWCALEVFDHLVKAESAILAEAREGLTRPHRIGLRDRLGYRFIEWVFLSPRRVKVPASATAVLPGPETTMQELRRRWEETGKDLEVFVSGLEPVQLSQGVFRHPVAGWMNVPMTIRFLGIHIRHHGYQLARLRGPE